MSPAAVVVVVVVVVVDVADVVFLETAAAEKRKI